MDDIELVKLLIGDTDPDTSDFTDTQYQAFLDLVGGNVYKAAVVAAQSLQFTYARLADEATGEVEVKWSQKARNMKDAVSQLKEDLARLAFTVPNAYLAGSKISDIRARDSNPDRNPNIFEIGQTDSEQFGIA